jgi:hypothetical protein
MAMVLLFCFPYVNQKFRIKSAGQMQDIEEESILGEQMYFWISFRQLNLGNLSS